MAWPHSQHGTEREEGHRKENERQEGERQEDEYEEGECEYQADERKEGNDKAGWVAESDRLMDLADVQRTYEAASAKASDIARQLAFAGVAIVWLFSGATGTVDQLRVTGRLLVAGLFLVSALALDLLHAVYRAAAWGIYGRILERRGRSRGVDAPAWINWPSIGLFGGKILAVAVAYILIGIYLGGKL